MDESETKIPKKTVLVVEDSQSQALALVSLLEGEGLEVLCADNGMDGFWLARERRPDLVILDIYLPDMLGMEVCYIMKRDPKTSRIPVVLLTSQPRQELREEGIETAGAVEFIPKDAFTTAVLLKFLQKQGFIEDKSTPYTS
jgi:CheY-like chemotaxis protein